MYQNTFSSRMCSDCAWLFISFWVLLALTKDSGAQELSPPASDFSRHRLSQPRIHHARTKREISSTRDTNGEHHSDITVTVTVDGADYVLDLRLNRDLVAAEHTIKYQKDGRSVLHKPKKEEIDLCHYSGAVQGRAGSWVAVSTCHGLKGVFFDGQKMRYIEPVEGNDIQSQHYIYDHQDLNTEYSCGYGGVTNSTTFDPELLERYSSQQGAKRSRGNRYKRSVEDTEVRGPYNSNKLSRYVELVLVADHREYQANGESMRTVHAQMIQVANIINSVYAPLNIYIALVGVVVWNERDEIQLEENGDRTLTNFLNYRERLVTDIPNDNAQLLTRQKFTDGVVGKALKGPICTYKFSGGVATNHSTVIGLVATTIAHEMGHNFGMEHDTEEDCKCPAEKCIMSPSSTSVVPTHWSSCSLKSLALSFERGMDYCLRNKPKRLFDSPTCGNGFIEIGEQCDCGIGDDAAACRACCHADTCMLRGNATCGAGECCDLTTCRPKSAGTVCRSAEKECDLPEYCTGHSEYCPDDVFKMDTLQCGKGVDQAYCVRGSCRSHNDQCRLLWGVTGESSHSKCYTSTNIKGTKNGNCGYDPSHQVYKPCDQSDSLCGMLQCRHLNERLEFGMESVAFLSAIFINNNGTIIPCRTAIIDLGLNDVDPGLVPDGAKCGHEKMCMNQRCLPIDYVKQDVYKMDSSVCPSNCSGHGVCNSKGHCHCDVGFAPPLCALPGSGGSVDSGPAADPSVQRNFMIAMYVIFLGIIPAVLLLLFLIYYSKHNVPIWKKPRKSAPSPKKASLQHRISRSASKFAANFQNNSQNVPQPVNVHTLSNPDDMSSSLLRSDSDRSPTGALNPSVNFFGNFKGFSLAPIEKAEEPEVADKKVKISENVKEVAKSAKITPVHRSSSNSQSIINQGVLKPVLRSAPPLPVVPTTNKSPNTSPSVKRVNSNVQNRIKALMNPDKEEFPVNTVIARPVISSPILEASTCTAKELISPLQGSKTLGPSRTAPTLPNLTPELPKRPLSMHSGTVPTKPLPEEPKKVKEGISLNRIASFLKPEKPKEKERKPVERSHSLPKNPNHLLKKDKAAIRNLQISNPILQKDIPLSVNTVPVVSDDDCDDPKSFVNRAQSMRAPATQKPVIQSFGSMRQAPGVPRPVSIVGRPTAPPPPLPNGTLPKNTTTNNDDNPISEDYVDCIEEKQAPLAHIDEESSDNIYAIIEESPVKSKPLPGVPTVVKTIPQPPPVGYNAPKPIPANSGSNESMGLLGEIVDEIQNRNFDSIYSASTLSRKKKGNSTTDRDSNTYSNEHYKTPESVYSNSGAKSTVSTTSSGYLHPSAVNVPTFPKKEDVKLDNEKAPPSPTLKGPNSKIPTFARQVTPPGLRNTSTFKNMPQSPKNTVKNANSTAKIANSPDVVSSCTMPETKNVKAPDVINNNKIPNEAPKVANKPTVTTKPNDNRPPLRPAPSVEKKPTLKTAPSIKPNPANSTKQIEKNAPLKTANAKTDANVKAIADNLNKNKPKVVPKPTTVAKSEVKNVKLTHKPSNVASLQQKFENRKSIGKEITAKK